MNEAWKKLKSVGTSTRTRTRTTTTETLCFVFSGPYLPPQVCLVVLKSLGMHKGDFWGKKKILGPFGVKAPCWPFWIIFLVTEIRIWGGLEHAPDQNAAGVQPQKGLLGSYVLHTIPEDLIMRLVSLGPSSARLIASCRREQFQ